jgi:hypothetical protein
MDIPWAIRPLHPSKDPAKHSNPKSLLINRGGQRWPEEMNDGELVLCGWWGAAGGDGWWELFIYITSDTLQILVTSHIPVPKSTTNPQEILKSYKMENSSGCYQIFKSFLVSV